MLAKCNLSFSKRSCKILLCLFFGDRYFITVSFLRSVAHIDLELRRVVKFFLNNLQGTRRFSIYFFPINIFEFDIKLN